MPIVGDFTVILGDATVVIGDTSNTEGWTDTFDTSGRLADEKAYLTIMVRGMTNTSFNAVVKVNGSTVGELFNTNTGHPLHWQTQSITVEGDTLENGNNEIKVLPVKYDEDISGPFDEDFDDFSIREVICHFHKEV